MSQPATSASGPRILYLVHRFPYPPDKGDRIRAFHIIRHLAGRCRLSVATLADEPVDPAYRAALSKHCEQLEVVPLQRTTRLLRGLKSLASGRTVTEGMFSYRPLRNLLRGWPQAIEFDSVLVSSSSMIPYLHLPELRQTPAVVDLVDVDSEKWLQYAHSTRSPLRWLYRTEGRRLRRLESRLPSSVKAVTLVSQQEADLYSRVCGNEHLVQAVTNGVDLDYFTPLPPSTERRCVFVGVMDYRPNIDAVTWFCENVWPELRRRVPDATFAIVGRSPAPAVRRLAALPGVEVTGSVPDVRPHIARAAVVVAPLQIARGVQNKVLEAMACGRPVVASPQALEGIEAAVGENLLRATTPDDWLTTLTALFTGASQREQLGHAARRYVEAKHAWSVRLGALADLLNVPAVNSALQVEPVFA